MKITVDTNDGPDEIRKAIELLNKLLDSPSAQYETSPSGAFSMFDNHEQKKDTEEKKDGSDMRPYF